MEVQIKVKKFKSRKINIQNKNKIIMIIGICPGKQRKNNSNFEVFHGNRTGDFIENIIKNKKNIYLTNILNYTHKSTLSNREIELAKLKLRIKINIIKPIKIICLGNTVKKILLSMINEEKVKCIFLEHPSFILRFNKDIENYKNKFEKELENENNN